MLILAKTDTGSNMWYDHYASAAYGIKVVQEEILGEKKRVLSTSRDEIPKITGKGKNWKLIGTE